MNTFPVQILAADHPFYEGECCSLVVPTLDGMYGIRARNSNMISVVATGILPASIRDACDTPVEYRETLILDGLFAIWQRNARK